MTLSKDMALLKAESKKQRKPKGKRHRRERILVCFNNETPASTHHRNRSEAAKKAQARRRKRREELHSPANQRLIEMLGFSDATQAEQLVVIKIKNILVPPMVSKVYDAGCFVKGATIEDALKALGCPTA
ncbi:MAG: hypothetical protein WB558_07465 [Terriglobales bacterium]